MTFEEMLAEIQKIAAREVDITQPLQREQQLMKDLGLDSMSLTVLAVAIEDHFRVKLTGDGADQVRTVGDLTDFVLRRLAQDGR